MENKQDYVARVQVAVSQLCNCGAVWRKTVPVQEKFQEHTVWQGEVEVFALNRHPQAKHAYGWSHREGENEQGERFVVVLEIPPVVSALTAVRASIMSDLKKAKNK